jgi:uncharacterized membrane protein
VSVATAAANLGKGSEERAARIDKLFAVPVFIAALLVIRWFRESENRPDHEHPSTLTDG